MFFCAVFHFVINVYMCSCNSIFFNSFVYVFVCIHVHFCGHAQKFKKGTFFLVKSIRRIQMHMDEKKKEKNLKYVQVLMHFFLAKILITNKYICTRTFSTFVYMYLCMNICKYLVCCLF